MLSFAVMSAIVTIALMSDNTATEHNRNKQQRKGIEKKENDGRNDGLEEEEGDHFEEGREVVSRETFQHIYSLREGECVL